MPQESLSSEPLLGLCVFLRETEEHDFQQFSKEAELDAEKAGRVHITINSLNSGGNTSNPDHAYSHWKHLSSLPVDKEKV